ncbi:MAG: tail fiber domain-containing protein [Betaproteobacteria bacterium]|nr:tail fiber domain-containing protein [Betaproteobacteria bacterium]
MPSRRAPPAACISSRRSTAGAGRRRRRKANLAPVDARAVMEKLARIPISTWNYKTQDAAIRHIGPMAQDFAAAFGVGEDERHITTIDADGVALAALQGLYQIVLEKNQRISRLEAELTSKSAAQDKRIMELEARLAGEPPPRPPPPPRGGFHRRARGKK